MSTLPTEWDQSLILPAVKRVRLCVCECAHGCTGGKRKEREGGCEREVNRGEIQSQIAEKSWETIYGGKKKRKTNQALREAESEKAVCLLVVCAPTPDNQKTWQEEANGIIPHPYISWQSLIQPSAHTHTHTHTQSNTTHNTFDVLGCCGWMEGC